MIASHPMKQLITRIDDDLHARLNERAAAEGRSVNALVTEVLRAAVVESAGRQRIRGRLAAGGRLVVSARPRGVQSLDRVIRAGRGAGRAVSDALRDERGAR